MNFDNLVDSVESYCDNSLTLNETLNVAYCFDDNCALSCGVSLFSLLENNSNLNIIVHLFVLSLSENNRIKFQQLV